MFFNSETLSPDWLSACIDGASLAQLPVAGQTLAPAAWRL